MNAQDDLVRRYFAAWNETEAPRRRDIIASTWTETATYRDPMLESEGQEGIHAMIGKVQQQFPGHTFQRIGEIDAHADRLRFSWKLVAPQGGTVAFGTDFAIQSSDGRFESVTGFFDRPAT